MLGNRIFYDWSHFKGIEALKNQATRIDGILFGTLILHEDGTLKFTLEPKKNNMFELFITLKGPIGTPLEVTLIFDKNLSFKILVFCPFSAVSLSKKQFLLKKLII